MKQLLQEKILKRSLHVAIIGPGYVGLPLATILAEAGFEVTGIDVDHKQVDQVNHGESYIPDIPSVLIKNTNTPYNQAVKPSAHSR